MYRLQGRRSLRASCLSPLFVPSPSSLLSTQYSVLSTSYTHRLTPCFHLNLSISLLLCNTSCAAIHSTPTEPSFPNEDRNGQNAKHSSVFSESSRHSLLSLSSLYPLHSSAPSSLQSIAFFGILSISSSSTPTAIICSGSLHYLILLNIAGALAYPESCQPSRYHQVVLAGISAVIASAI